MCRPRGGLCEGLSIVGNVPSPCGRGNTKSPGVSLGPVCDTLPVQGKNTTIYDGCARVCRGRDDGTDTLQNQRLRLAGAGVAAAHIHQDIITGTVMQRPGLDGLLNALQSGDALVVNALDRLGSDTLGLLEQINRLATMSVNLKVLDMPVDTQDVAGGGQPVALVTAGVAAIERANISRHTKQGLERARADGKLAGRALEHHPGADAHHRLNAERPGPDPGPDRPGSGSVGIAAATGFES